ncbi:MAG: GIY-YIG nuclease family protein, partial [Bacteroidota bacterium]
FGSTHSSRKSHPKGWLFRYVVEPPHSDGSITSAVETNKTDPKGRLFRYVVQPPNSDGNMTSAVETNKTDTKGWLFRYVVQPQNQRHQFCITLAKPLKMIQPLPFCTYVLFSEKDQMLYVGFSSNLTNRILRHNSGGVKSTSYRRPLKLIFCEFYLFEKDARNREMYFKTTAGKKAIKLMLRSTLHTLGYAEKVSFIFNEEDEN